jgi:hypothetical protein
MTRKPVLVVVAMLLAGTAVFRAMAQAPDRVQVRYLQPEKFTDAGRYWGGDASREHNLAELARHMERRAARLLPEGQRFVVSVTDVDLAGGYEPWRQNLGDVRIVRDVYPPRIDLSFQLMDADGSVLKEGKRSLRDLAFQVSGATYRDDPLRYEKALIDGWTERELQPAIRPPL